jgi:nondiscriminating glutamyl-tRNA synthetase
MAEEIANSVAAPVNPFTAADVVEIARQRSWVPSELSTPQWTWCEHAAAVLGPQVADRSGLADLLALIFHYDAREILAGVESHVVLSRYAARDVLRQLALLLLNPAPLNSESFKDVITALKEGLDIRGRELFHPIRLALAGRSGEGELDRVILLVDEAAAAEFLVPVKTARERIIEFCAAFD